MFRKLLSGLAITVTTIAPFTMTDSAQALVGSEQEPNGTIERAQNIDSLFSSGFDPDIAFSSNPRFHHATIKGTGIATPFWDNFDFFSFTIDRAGGRGIFDIDRTLSTASIHDRCTAVNINRCSIDRSPLGFDTRLFLFDPNLISQAFSDDEFATLGGTGSRANSPLGQGLSLDPYIGAGAVDFTFQTAGTYYVGVNFGALEGFRRQTGRYELNIAIEKVPEPATVLALFGVAGYLAQQRRPRRPSELRDKVR